MPALLGLGLAAAFLVVLGGAVTQRRPVPEEAARPMPTATAEQLQLCVTPRGFCPVGGPHPEGEPCKCVDTLQGMVQGRAWSLDTVLAHPGLLPDAPEADPDE